MDGNEKYPCPICGAMELSEPKGSFDICPVCGWEDDYLGQDYPDEPGMHKEWTLNAARKAWAAGETLFEDYPNPKGK